MRIKLKKDQLKNLIILYIRMMEKGYKFRYWVWKKEKYNIAQNESNKTIFYEVDFMHWFRKIKERKNPKTVLKYANNPFCLYW